MRSDRPVIHKSVSFRMLSSDWRTAPLASPPLLQGAALLLCLATLLAGSMSRLAAAQERLPSLTPREFTVEGDVEIRLPDIERQPLSGFGPPPRSYVIPADRAPTVRPYSPDFTALPPLTLAPPRAPAVNRPKPVVGRVEGGAGLSYGRYGRVDLTLPGASGLFYVDADYDGLAANEDAAETTETVAFNRLAITAGGRTLGATQIRLDGGALYDRIDIPETAGPDLPDVRSRTSLAAGFGVEHLRTTPAEVNVRFQSGSIGPAGSVSGLDESRRDARVEADGVARLLGDRLHLDAMGGSLGLDGEVTGAARYGSAGASVGIGGPIVGSFGLRLRAGARALAYAAGDDNGSGNAAVVSPIVELTMPAGPLEVFASNRPHLTPRGISDLYGTAPYLSPDALIIPDVVTVDAEAGVEVRGGPVRVRGFVTYLAAPTYVLFEQSSPGAFLTQSIESLRSAGLGGDATVALPGGISTSAGMHFRSAELDETGDAVPFYPGAVGRAGVQMPFAGSRGRLGVTALVESNRPADRAETTSAPAVADLSADARYALTPTLTLIARGERLLGDLERWPGFRTPPTVMAGLRLTW